MKRPHIGLFLGALQGATPTPQSHLVLDQTCALRQYYRFDLNRYSVELLKSEGDKVLGRTVRKKRSSSGATPAPFREARLQTSFFPDAFVV